MSGKRVNYGDIFQAPEIHNCITKTRYLLFPMADEKLQKCSVDDEIESEGGNRVFERSSENGVKRQRHEKSRPRIQTMIEQLKTKWGLVHP